MRIDKYIFLLLMFSALSLSSCKTKYIQVPEYHYETIVKTDSFIQRDSVHFYDSVYVEKNGDTVIIYKTKIQYRDRWKEVIKIDTFIKTDSIKVPYPVEKQLTLWQRTKLKIGGYLLFGYIAVLAIMIIGCFYGLKKRI